MEVCISGFCDEVCEDKRLDVQFAVAAALGLRFISLRFFNLGAGPRNILDASDQDVHDIERELTKAGLTVSSIGSPLGKVKLLDVEDGTGNRFRDFESYLDQEVTRMGEIAQMLQVKLVRGFSFYHPRGSLPQTHIEQCAERLRRIARRFQDFGLIYGLEVEANLVGHSGRLVAELIRSVGEKNLVSIFDGANLAVQGFSPEQIWEEWQAMLPGLGWIHVKDYQSRGRTARSPGPFQDFVEVDEESLAEFVPVGLGESQYHKVFAALLKEGPSVLQRLRAAGMDPPRLFLDLEPHLRKGGQFGGFSGPDGFGVALRSLATELQSAGLSYQLRGWPLPVLAAGIGNAN